MDEQVRSFNMVRVESSQLAEVGYDAPSQKLRIQFAARKDGTPGQTYEYDNIEPSMHQDLMKAKSKGGFFKANIKPFAVTFPYRKIELEVKASA